MLSLRHIWKCDGLARRLLRTGVGIVFNSALYGMVIYCVGCVIPTPLDRAPAPTNFGPVFVTSQVTPPFGPVSESLTSGVSLALAATDPNPDDILTVHLFVPDPTTPGGFIYTDINTQLTNAGDTDDPNLRIGSLAPALCFSARSGDKFDVFAVVADRPFNTTGNLTHADGGLTDSNHWELSCM
jgi:hypothetical protein